MILPGLVLNSTALRAQHYSGNSFRIAGATSTITAGLNDYEIKLLGSYKRYIRSS